MRIKMCGVTNPSDAVLVSRCGADFVGLILATSPRQVTVEVAREVVRALPPDSQPVLVFRDAPAEVVRDAVNATGCRWIQLHGRETLADIETLRRRCPHVRIMKGWEVGTGDAEGDLMAYLAPVAGGLIDVVILDAPKAGPHPGYERLGELSRQLRARPPEVWCAGGLTAGNVAAALAAGCYDGVDVAGGVEVSPGHKDETLVRRFIAVVRSTAPRSASP